MTFNCPICGTPFIKGTRFCQACGCNLEIEFIESPTCPQCKKGYPAGTKFCVADGSKLVRPEELIPRCVICNREYSDDVKFCPQDGGAVRTGIAKGISQSANTNFSLQSPLIDGSYPKASLGNRFLAALLDGLITVAMSIPAILFFVAGMDKTKDYEGSGEASGYFVAAFLLYLVPLVYNLIKDGLGQGQSWGKRSLNLMVISLDDKSSCSMGKSFLRNFISALIGIIPFVGWLIEPIMVLATEDGRKLGDKAANTQVIDKNSIF